MLFSPAHFITLIPALALLSGLALSRGIYLFKRDASIEVILAITLLLVFIGGLGASSRVAAPFGSGCPRRRLSEPPAFRLCLMSLNLLGEFLQPKCPPE